MIYQVGEFDLLGRFLTGLGVAGLAASLAAQDALKSYFGTLLLIGERAFKIGDHISVGGNEGVVEQVGFRSTRLRNAEGSLLTVPNAIIAASPIDNRGAGVHSGTFRTSVVMSPGTALPKVLEFRDRLRAWLSEQPALARGKADVHVRRVTGRGVELSLNLSLGPAAAAEEAQFREALVCEIVRLAGSLGVDIAPAHCQPLPGTGGPSRAAAAKGEPRAA
jgi:MscS family membrane protein